MSNIMQQNTPAVLGYRATLVPCPEWCTVDHCANPDHPHMHVLAGFDGDVLEVDLQTDEQIPGDEEVMVWFRDHDAATLPADPTLLRQLGQRYIEAADALEDLRRPSIDAGHVIRTFREAVGQTVEELADDSGLSVERVQAIEAPGGLMTHAEHRQLTCALGEAVGRVREDRTA